MPYTPEKTWTTETLTASDLNTYLRDNVDYVKAAVDGIAFTGCKVTRSTAQSIADSTNTNISYNTESFDSGGWFPGSGTTVTVPSGAIPSGYTTIALLVQGYVRFVANSTGGRQAWIMKNGSQEDSTSVSAINGDTTDLLVLSIITAVSGDTITFQVRQTSGGNLNADVNKLTVVRYAPVS